MKQHQKQQKIIRLGTHGEDYEAGCLTRFFT